MVAHRTIDDLDTPCVLIDIDRASANILRAQAYADAHGKKLRPHIKTHKLPYWAKKQVEAGAVGITRGDKQRGRHDAVGRYAQNLWHGWKTNHDRAKHVF